MTKFPKYFKFCLLILVFAVFLFPKTLLAQPIISQFDASVFSNNNVNLGATAEITGSSTGLESMVFLHKGPNLSTFEVLSDSTIDCQGHFTCLIAYNHRNILSAGVHQYKIRVKDTDNNTLDSQIKEVNIVNVPGLKVVIGGINPASPKIGDDVFVTATATWFLSDETAIANSGNLELELDFIGEEEEILQGNNEMTKSAGSNSLTFSRYTFPGHKFFESKTYTVRVTANATSFTGLETTKAETQITIADTGPAIVRIESPYSAEQYDNVDIKVYARDDLWVYGIYIEFEGDNKKDTWNKWCSPQQETGTNLFFCEFENIYTTTGNKNIEVYARDSNGFQDNTPRQESDLFIRSIIIYEKGGQPPPDPNIPPDPDITIGPITLDNPLTSNTFGEFIDKLISFVFTLALILFPILLIVAGIMFLTAGGDPAKVQQARKLLIYAVIGFAIIALAKLFVALIQDVFGVKKQT